MVADRLREWHIGINGIGHNGLNISFFSAEQGVKKALWQLQVLGNLVLVCHVLCGARKRCCCDESDVGVQPCSEVVLSSAGGHFVALCWTCGALRLYILEHDEIIMTIEGDKHSGGSV